MKNRKFWNKCLALALSTAMICSSGSVAFAAEFSAGDDIAAEQTAPENEAGGALSSQDTPQKETSEADFAAPEETEEFESGVPEAEKFGDVENAAGTESGVAGSVVAKIGNTEYTSLQSALDNAVSSNGDVIVDIQNDIVLSEEWNSPSVRGDTENHLGVVTVNGNNHTISGLTKPLFSGTWAGNSGLIINNLTIKDSTIVDDGEDTSSNVGVGAFIGYPQASATITLNGCHLAQSTVQGGHWTGGLIGMAGGYSGTDGPVFMNLNIENCSIVNSEIKGKGSVGGVIGHAACDAWTMVSISNTTISGNTIISMGTSTVKAGTVMGTVGAAGTEKTVNDTAKTGGVKVKVTETGNNVSSNNASIKTVYGRQGTETGKLTITGGEYDNPPINSGDTWATLAENLKICKSGEKYIVGNGFTVIFTNIKENESSIETVLSGEKVPEPATPIREGYDFAGWYKDQACTEKYDFNTAVTTDLTLYAKWTVKPEHAAVKINDDIYYDSLSTAITASQDGDKITLLNNIDLGIRLDIQKAITLDLNGKTLAVQSNGVFIKLYKDFVLCDSSVGKTGKLVVNNNLSNGMGLVVNSGVTSVQSGTITAPNIGIKVQETGHLELRGGKINSTNTGVMILGSKPGTSVDVYDTEITGNCGIYIANIQETKSMENAPVLNVYGGTIKGTSYGIAGNGTNDCTNINITGGKITSDTVGIFYPQIGDLFVGGNADITAPNGIQYCGAGEVKISDSAKITATANYYPVPSKLATEDDGTVDDGAALSLISRGGGYQDATHKMTVTISGGTLVSNNNAPVSVYRFAKVNGAWVANENTQLSTDYLTSLSITGGYFKGSPAKDILDADALSRGKISISGGYFSHMPDKSYVAEGKKVVASENSDCPFTIGNKTTEEGKTQVETAVIEPTVDTSYLPNNMSEENKQKIETAAKSLKAPGLEVAANDIISSGDVTKYKEDAKQVKVNDVKPLENKDDAALNIISTTYLEVKAISYEEGNETNNKILTFEIKPMRQMVVSTETNPNKFVFTRDNSESSVNAVKIGPATLVEDKELKVRSLEMSLDLPTGFVGAGVNTVYVEHIKNGTVYNYKARVESTDDGGKRAVFNNPDGFSTFRIQTNSNAASIGETSYPTLKAAIDAVQGNSPTTIKLLDDVTVSQGNGISINDEDKKITLNLNGHKVARQAGDTSGSCIINSGSLKVIDSIGSGTIDGIFNWGTTVISSGTVTTLSGTATLSVEGGNIGKLYLNSGNQVIVNISDGTVNDIEIHGGTVNIYGGTITGNITNNNGTINAYGGTFTTINKDSITPAPGYYFDGNTIKSIPAPSLSSNNYLSGLKLSQGTLTPAFDRNTTAYTVEVENTTDSITVTPVKDSYWASLTVNGKTVASETASEAIALNEGANTITVRVTAENGSTKDYTITVTRKAAPGKEYIKLQKAAADYAAYENEGYTESSWTAFEKALKEAQEALKDTSLSEEKAAELLANLDKAAGELKKVGTPEIESVKVSGNKVTVKLTGATENAEGYDYVIGKKNCITTKKYVDIRKNCGTTATFSYVQKGTYYVYCHAWKKVNGKKVFSDWSELSSFKIKATTVSAPKITSVKVKGRTVTVTIKNAKGTIGVDAVLGKKTIKDQYGKRPSDYGKLVIRNKKTTTIIFENVPKGTYYVGVHAFNRSGGTNSKVFSKWSNIKKAVMK